MKSGRRQETLYLDAGAREISTVTLLTAEGGHEALGIALIDFTVDILRTEI